MLSCGARQHEDNTEISSFLGSARICKAECHLSYTNYRAKQLSWVALEYRKGTTVPWGVQKERHAHGYFFVCFSVVAGSMRITARLAV